ncbi:Hypothetical_protein [Hexamita inflata]|uniref:Hypothetical_protein n=1 Tax=Hexamita inflata TaxID=28002 RepID=A0AA86Q0S0_9EUKA|nr:Hypothetical protein HINF_LOCUS37609 [Hexamita inflata]CAI9960386.1 Hypothetical protein HINF_LOCUS48031 [Hexamita inflata]
MIRVLSIQHQCFKIVNILQQDKTKIPAIVEPDKFISKLGRTQNVHLIPMYPGRWPKCSFHGQNVHTVVNQLILWSHSSFSLYFSFHKCNTIVFSYHFKMKQ